MTGHNPWPPIKPGHFRIWYVKDAMGENKISDVIDNKYYSTHAEALAARTEYSYGYVSYHELKEDVV